MTSTAQPILSRQTVLLLVAAFGGMSGFYLLLSVAPLYLADADGGTVGAGLATGVMMLGTVLIELVVPRMLIRLGYRVVLALGLLLLGAPALVLLGSSSIGVVLLVCLVRGAGLGILVVVGSALATSLAPPGRRGEALAVYGLVVGIPAVIGVPAGIWLSAWAGFPPVFILATVVALLPVVVVVALRPPPADPSSEPDAGSVLGALRVGGFAGPTLIFTLVTVAAGVYATFLPLAVPASSRGVAAIALLVQAVTMALARLAAGRYGDRRGAGRLLVPGVLVGLAGAVLAVWTGNPVAIIAGMALYGAGFGVIQNVTLALMMDRSHPGGYGRTSALWNLAYDGGFGLGAIGFGLVVGPAGYGFGFALTAAVLAAALVPAWKDRTWGR